ncbi:MAG: hypothetical protein ABIE14_02875 [Patescibacteria group bacterium]
MKNELLSSPTFWAFIGVVIAASVHLWVAYKNRESILNREIYFKKQQIAERIIESLLHFISQLNELALTFLDNSADAMFSDGKIGTLAIKINKDFEGIRSLIEIYFNDVDKKLLSDTDSFFEDHVKFVMSLPVKEEQWKKHQKNVIKIILQLLEQPRKTIKLIKTDLRRIEDKL